MGLQGGSVADLLALKRTKIWAKSRCFAFIPIISEPETFYFVTISRPIQIALLRSTNFGPKRKRSACKKKLFGTKSKCFTIVQIVSGPIKMFCFRFDIVDITIREPNLKIVSYPYRVFSSGSDP